jgi:hypothetical protein
MRSALLRALIAIAIPVIVFIAPAYLMMNLTGRDQYPQTEAAASVPLNFRPMGYNSDSASEYWAWLGPQGRLAERRFLVADLAFPLAYGASLVVGLLISWVGARKPIGVGWLVAPVVVTIVADWTENLVHLAQLSHFESIAVVDGTWMHVASAATSIKIVAYSLSAVLILVFCGMGFLQGRGVVQQLVPGDVPASRGHP